MLAGSGPDALQFWIGFTELLSLTVVRAIDGVRYLAVAGKCGPGTGYICATGDGTSLSWRAPGSTNFGQPLHVGADGEYLLCDGEDPDKWLRIAVTLAWLKPATGRLDLRDLYDYLGASDVAAEHALTGGVTMWFWLLRNDGGAPLYDIKVWLDEATDYLEISDDNVNWVSPTTEATALEFPTLAAEGTDIIYFKRTIPASTNSDGAVLNQLHYSYATI